MFNFITGKDSLNSVAHLRDEDGEILYAIRFHATNERTRICTKVDPFNEEGFRVSTSIYAHNDLGIVSRQVDSITDVVAY